jgi:hypothetical protein
MTNPLGSRTHAGAPAAYDVKVLAFPAASPRTVQGLMQLFNTDQASAERLIASVPLLLAQQVSAQDAEACAQALRMLGARVVVEPAAVAGAQRWSEPNTFEEDLLPQPRAVQVANDTELEYDVLSAQEPGYQAHESISTSLRSPVDMDLGAGPSDHMADDPALRRQRQESIDLQGSYGSTGPGPGLELAATGGRERKAQAQPERSRSQTREPTGPQPVVRARPVEGGAAPHSRAAVVARAAEVASPSRTLPLVQVCFALGVAAIGYWSESSVIFGSAGLWSVIAHGVALYQLVLGIRGLSA